MSNELQPITTSRDYDGITCPVCHIQFALEGGKMIPDTDTIERKCSCSTCGAQWNEHFMLTGYYYLRDNAGIRLQIPDA